MSITKLKKKNILKIRTKLTLTIEYYKCTMCLCIMYYILLYVLES